jgi:hypothetical protein
MVVHETFAVLLASAPRWEGTLSQTKLTPIARALSADFRRAEFDDSFCC